MRFVDFYYDFRSPFAYFAAHRIRTGAFQLPANVAWRWHPVSIGALINFQAGRQPFEAFADPLAPPKRAHFMADVVRNAQFYRVPITPPNPQRPTLRRHSTSQHAPAMRHFATLYSKPCGNASATLVRPRYCAIAQRWPG
jgi:2-hydroxychromene-2-carboxylate isomerase